MSKKLFLTGLMKVIEVAKASRIKIDFLKPKNRGK